MPFVAATLLLAAATSFQCVRAATGGSACPSLAMCITAVSDGTKVTYQLKTTLSPSKLGWMALGFGTQMPDSPMVIMWPNDDGTMTLSQREAPDHIMPTVVPNPPEVATLSWPNIILSASDSTALAFDYPLPSDLSAVDLLFAYSNARPSSSAVDATMQQHLESGPFVMDLTRSVDALATGPYSSGTATIPSTPIGGTGTTGTSSSNTTFTGSIGLTPDEKKIRTHGILMTTGFLILLPLGVFIARFSRTVPFLQRKWFTAHWIIQLVLTGPIILAGVSLAAETHFTVTASNHKGIGWGLLGMYVAQVLWGAIIHFWKPKPKVRDGSKETATNGSDTPASSMYRMLGPLSPSYYHRYPAICARPLQNYGHAILGLTIISLAFYQVRLGYHLEWEFVFGLPYTYFLKHFNAWWVSWVIIIPCIYVAGLTLLPRQWRQEDPARQQQHAQNPSDTPQSEL
ncbi:hypothetical protein FRB93_010145 [Tulasnella sp. JGI-2019a]|nr:hypothetical protein FRB93_010145 [Tulasnella sp. JGI-2019a]